MMAAKLITERVDRSGVCLLELGHGQRQSAAADLLALARPRWAR